MLWFFSFFFFNEAQGCANYQPSICPDRELKKVCDTYCRADLLKCRFLCNNDSCYSVCERRNDACTKTCPCGDDCPTGCKNCESRFCVNDDFYQHDSNTQTTTLITTTSQTPTTTPSYVAPPGTNKTFIMAFFRNPSKTFILSGDGNIKIDAPVSAEIPNFPESTVWALLKGQLHFFGGKINGDRKSIGVLEGCNIKLLNIRLNYDTFYGGSALTIDDGRKVLICWPNYWEIPRPEKKCDVFDGEAVNNTFDSIYNHQAGSLGFYKNRPTGVTGYYAEGKMETLAQNGWTALPDIPRKFWAPSSVGLDNGDLVVLGGRAHMPHEEEISDIWMLSAQTDSWSKIGNLRKGVFQSSALMIGSSIFVFPGYGPRIDGGSVFATPIQRVDLQNSSVIHTEVIGYGYQPNGASHEPAILHLNQDHCSCI